MYVFLGIHVFAFLNYICSSLGSFGPTLYITTTHKSVSSLTKYLPLSWDSIHRLIESEVDNWPMWTELWSCITWNICGIEHWTLLWLLWVNPCIVYEKKKQQALVSCILPHPHTAHGMTKARWGPAWACTSAMRVGSELLGALPPLWVRCPAQD